MSHLQDIKMTYFEHMLGAFVYATKSLFASAIFVFHGIFPNYCVHTGSNIIKHLHNTLVKIKQKEKKEEGEEQEEETNNMEKII
jgi:hypothetical protein